MTVFAATLVENRGSNYSPSSSASTPSCMPPSPSESCGRGGGDDAQASSDCAHVQRGGHAELAMETLLLRAENSSTSATGTTRGCSTLCSAPSVTRVAAPRARTFFNQSVLGPYGSAIANPSGVRTATTGVSYS